MSTEIEQIARRNDVPQTDDESPSGIVCGIDFTEASLTASTVAAVLAGRLRAPLTLVHALEKGMQGYLTPEMAASIEEAVRQRGRDECARLSELVAHGLEISQDFVGGPADEVLIARSAAAGLLVLSSVSERGHAARRLGTVCGRVAENPRCPVLVIRSSEPFERWARGEHTLRILAGVDFSASSEAALRFAGRLYRAGGCEVVAAFVDRPVEQRLRDLPSAGGGCSGDPATLQAALEKLLTRSLGRMAPGSVRMRAQPCRESPESTLVQIAEEENADLIVVGIHAIQDSHRLRHGSISRGVLHRAPMNVACVPAAAPPALTGHVSRVRRVLMPTDLSDESNGAMSQAFGLAGEDGAVCLLHITPPLEARTMCRRDFPRMEFAVDCLRALAEPFSRESGVPVQIKVVEDGNPAVAICEFAAHFGADIICMAGRSRKGMARARVGSVADEVLTRSALPVVILPAGSLESGVSRIGPAKGTSATG